MSIERINHSNRISNWFQTKQEAKYLKGQKEHGGSLWEKTGMLSHAIEEVIDLAVYLETMEEQLKEQFPEAYTFFIGEEQIDNSEFWIVTASGKRFDFNPINLDAIDIKDIAHALSNLCRFGGHCQNFYSVAQHSCFVASLVSSKEEKMAALLHDASEAYLVDIPRPIKHSSFLAGYRNLERKLEEAIQQKFSFVMNGSVQKADNLALVSEAYTFCNVDQFKTYPIFQQIEPIPMFSITWSPAVAERRFLDLFDLFFMLN